MRKLEFMRLKKLAAASEDTDRRMDFNAPGGLARSLKSPWRKHREALLY